MKNENIKLRELFFIFFKINMFTFGGGYTIIPVIIDEFSKKRSFIAEEEMIDIVAIAQSGPGPMAINTSILAGYRMKGMCGAFTSLLASVLPCLIVISLLYYVYSSIIHIRLIQTIMECMAGAMSAILGFTVFNMSKKALSKYKKFGTSILIVSILLAFFTDISAVLIILFAGLIGLTIFLIVEEDKIC
ncbi:chromate transporter [Peptostreptococcus sp. D1]|uniref:chromate transporter n=1 Tax=Peptostreptococcus sp. D1 TaxID=72304 RepID=UPI0008EAB6A1|nr:chromate transporter [Peptostreptococcus sp. D1]SFE44314.1 chromate transporter [Peptostreptococcus sp. D1]